MSIKELNKEFMQKIESLKPRADIIRQHRFFVCVCDGGDFDDGNQDCPTNILFMRSAINAITNDFRALDKPYVYNWNQGRFIYYSVPGWGY